MTMFMSQRYGPVKVRLSAYFLPFSTALHLVLLHLIRLKLFLIELVTVFIFHPFIFVSYPIQHSGCHTQKTREDRGNKYTHKIDLLHWLLHSPTLHFPSSLSRSSADVILFYTKLSLPFN